ncbi:MAG: hypothetical protein ACOC33_00725 [bacterium]
MDTLFENYESFLKEHRTDISTPADALKMISDNGMFRSYIDTLSEGLEPQQRAVVMAVANRQRDMLLTESSNVPSSSFALGWTVASFPILVDIYAEPLISELCNVWTTDSHIISIPRVRIKAQTTNYDGSTRETLMPTLRSMVRADVHNETVSPGTTVNLLSAVFGGDASRFRMNRRYMNIRHITINDSGNQQPVVLNVNIRPDNRSQLLGQIEYTTSDNKKATITLNGFVEWEKGNVLYHVNIDDGGSSANIEVDSAVFTCRFTPVRSFKGRTKVQVTTEMQDLTIDPNEDFLVDLTQEDVQDYKSIFKIDLLRTLSEAIKRQVLLNKDQDLAYFLEAAEPDMEANGTSMTINFDDFTNAGGHFDPNNVMQLMQNLTPRVATIISYIRRNYNMYPSYIVAGVNTASLLRSMQDMAVSMPNLSGQLGWSGTSGSFLKMRVLESAALPEDRFYVSTKAPQNALEKSTILDLIYQPLYIIQEVDQGNMLTFVRSRTMIEVARTDGLGVIKCNDLTRILK